MIIALRIFRLNTCLSFVILKSLKYFFVSLLFRNFLLWFNVNMLITQNYLKPLQKLPQVLFYNTKLEGGYNQVVAFKLNKKGFAKMICHVYDKPMISTGQKPPVLIIDLLISIARRQGLGSSLINYAKNFSKKQGCEGKLCLKADVSFDINHIPHVFYRKMGFGALDVKDNIKIDKAIQKHKNLTYKDLPCLTMVYPAPIQKKTFTQKCSEFMSKIFNI